MSTSLKADAIQFEQVLMMSEFNWHQFLAIFYASANNCFEEETQNSMSKSVSCTKTDLFRDCCICVSVRPNQDNGLLCFSLGIIGNAR